MKKLFTYLFFTLLLVCTFSVATAQPEKRDKIDALRVAFITKNVNLTTQEAQVFWPLYNEMNDKVEAARKTFRQQYNKRTNYNFETDQEAEAYITAELTLKQKEYEIFKEYTEKIKKVLPAKKVAAWRRAEDEFKKELVKIAKGN